MPGTKEKLLKALKDAAVEMDEDQAVELSSQVIKEGIDAFEAIDQGLAKGMRPTPARRSSCRKRFWRKALNTQGGTLCQKRVQPKK